MGEKFWTHLQLRRDQLYHFGLDQPFVSEHDILQAAQAELLFLEEQQRQADKKRKDEQSFLSNLKTQWRKKFQTPDDLTDKKQVMRKSSNVLPLRSKSIHHEHDLHFLKHYPNAEKAWQVTADNLLASIYIRNKALTIGATADGLNNSRLAEEYTRISHDLVEGKLEKIECQSVWKAIVVDYGYQFTDFIFRLSHSADFVQKEDERKIAKRFKKAMQSGVTLSVDTSQVTEVSFVCYGSTFFSNISSNP